MEGPSDGHKRDWRIITARGGTLLSHKVSKEQQHAEDGATGAPVACVKAPKRIKPFQCHDAAMQTLEIHELGFNQSYYTFT